MQAKFVRTSVAAGLALLVGCAVVAAAIAPTAGDTAAAPTSRTADLACPTTRSIGVAAPVTGAAASLGQQQLSWARYYVTRYNRTHQKVKFRVVVGDTQSPAT